MLKTADALVLYESILEAEPQNVEAHVGKGICLQSKNLPRQAFESFANALRLDAQNACALTHCGILYKEEGHLLEAAEVGALCLSSKVSPRQLSYIDSIFSAEAHHCGGRCACYVFVSKKVLFKTLI